MIHNCSFLLFLRLNVTMTWFYHAVWKSPKKLSASHPERYPYELNNIPLGTLQGIDELMKIHIYLLKLRSVSKVNPPRSYRAHFFSTPRLWTLSITSGQGTILSPMVSRTRSRNTPKKTPNVEWRIKSAELRVIVDHKAVLFALVLSIDSIQCRNESHLHVRVTW